MNILIKTILLCFLLSFSMPGFSKNLKRGNAAENEKQTVELIINGDKYPITNVNPNSKVEVYNIIGSKVISFELKTGISDTSINLPKGYYIIKIDDTTRKIAVK